MTPHARIGSFGWWGHHTYSINGMRASTEPVFTLVPMTMERGTSLASLENSTFGVLSCASFDDPGCQVAYMLEDFSPRAWYSDTATTENRAQIVAASPTALLQTLKCKRSSNNR